MSNTIETVADSRNFENARQQFHAWNRKHRPGYDSSISTIQLTEKLIFIKWYTYNIKGDPVYVLQVYVIKNIRSEFYIEFKQISEKTQNETYG